MYHIFAFILCFLVQYQAGMRNILIPSPRPLVNLRPAFARHRIDRLYGVDTLYAGLLAEPWFRDQPPPIKVALAGGTALRPATGEAWQRNVGLIIEGYGLTETTCIVCCNPPDPARVRPGTAGVPMPGCDVRMVDDAWNDVPLGTPGELVVRGGQVIGAYHNQPEETAKAIRDGWLRTGDIAAFDADGYIRILDRNKDMILVSGFNVYPNEVEAVIAEHPAVAEVAVVGVPDAKTGEAVLAFIATRGPVTAAEVLDLCRRNLAAYKVPREISFRDTLPKSTVGKILRADLRRAARGLPPG